MEGNVLHIKFSELFTWLPVWLDLAIEEGFERHIPVVPEVPQALDHFYDWAHLGPWPIKRCLFECSSVCCEDFSVLSKTQNQWILTEQKLGKDRRSYNQPRWENDDLFATQLWKNYNGHKCQIFLVEIRTKEWLDLKSHLFWNHLCRRATPSNYLCQIFLSPKLDMAQTKWEKW